MRTTSLHESTAAAAAKSKTTMAAPTSEDDTSVGPDGDACLVVLEERGRGLLRKPEVGEESAHLQDAARGVEGGVVLAIDSLLLR